MSRPAGSGPVARFAPDLLTELFQNPLEPGYADAARRKATGMPSGRGLSARGISLVALVAIGFLLAVSWQLVLADKPERTLARSGLVNEIQDKQRETDELRKQADALGETVARERDAALDDTAAARLQALEATTGLARVRGNGVVVTVADAPNTNDGVTGQDDQANLGRVLDRDLQQISNALWQAGAEAISINGQRLISTSTIRAAGAAILVDFRPVSGPYEVTAIGPKDLDKKFNASLTARTFHELVQRYGMSFSVKHKDDVTIPAASDPQLRYARPVPSASPSSSVASPAGSPSEGGR